MGRTAEYSIQGYLYQFLKYLLEILAADLDAPITIEGAIEDIDVQHASGTRAVQCKYHAQSEKFTLGKIYKPILLMLEHHATGPVVPMEVGYHLFCHFPGETGDKELTLSEIKEILDTTAKNLLPIVARIGPNPDLASFGAKLRIEFGPALKELEGSVISALEAEGFGAADVKAIMYPAALQKVVDTSICSDVAGRTLTRRSLMSDLHATKSVTLTRWTRELATRAQMFERIRRDLRESLNRNQRRRFVIINDEGIEDFDNHIVDMMRKFANEYSVKYLHEDPPAFLFSDGVDISNLVIRLHDRGVRCETGVIGGTEFRQAELFREPVRSARRNQSANLEFRIRIQHFSKISAPAALNPDEVIIVNWPDQERLFTDTTVFAMRVENLAELEYVFRLRGAYG